MSCKTLVGWNGSRGSRGWSGNLAEGLARCHTRCLDWGQTQIELNLIIVETWSGHEQLLLTLGLFGGRIHVIRLRVHLFLIAVDRETIPLEGHNGTNLIFVVSLLSKLSRFDITHL